MLCDDEGFSFTGFMDTLSGILGQLDANNQQLFFGKLEDKITVIASYKDTMDKIYALESAVGGVSGKLFCIVIKSFNLETYLEEIEELSEKLVEKVLSLEEELADIEFESFSDLEEQIDKLTRGLEQERDAVITVIDDRIKAMFSLLEDFGTDPIFIENAITDVIFQDDIQGYVLGIFTNILDQVIEDMNKPRGRNA